MQKGTIVQARNDHNTNPMIRGKQGTVIGRLPSGYIQVQFSGEDSPVYLVDEKYLDVISSPENTQTSTTE